MLFIFLYHFVVTLVCSLTGVHFYSLFNGRKNKPIIFYPVTGLIIISLIAQVVVLFFPVNSYVFFCSTGFLMIISLVREKNIIQFYKTIANNVKQCHPFQFILLAVFWLLVVVLSAGPTMMDDTESYHIQMVQWIHEYGTVPGLANLHARYGFNSSWFSVISFFLPSTSSLNYYTSLNGLLSVWLGSYLIFQLPLSSNLTGKQQRRYVPGFFFVLLFSLGCWPLIRGNAATANYDFVTTVLLFVLFAETVRQNENGDGFQLQEEWILWPAFLFTVRITNFPFLLLMFFSFWHLIKQKAWRKVLLLGGIAVCLAIPFISRNLILSGYPFYPAKQLALFRFDWTVDETTVNDLLYFIKNFNRVNTGFMNISDTAKLSFPNWIPVWFRYLFSYDKLLLIPGLLGIALAVVNIRKSNSQPVRYFILVVLLQMFAWFFIAPDPRFVYGCLLIGIFLLMQYAIKKTVYFSASILKKFVVVSMTFLLFSFTLLKIWHNPEYRNFILPYRLPQPPVSTVTVDGLQLFIPEKVGTNWNARCYATDLPCLYSIKPGLRARGSSIRDGFRVEKTH